MRKPMAVQTHTPLNALFLRMKKQKMHMAIVENENADALGVVTMNDVLEALFEDIVPEAPENTVEGKV
jgi:CBS domain containing-hemolysin-like protein